MNNKWNKRVISTILAVVIVASNNCLTVYSSVMDDQVDGDAVFEDTEEICLQEDNETVDETISTRQNGDILFKLDTSFSSVKNDTLINNENQNNNSSSGADFTTVMTETCKIKPCNFSDLPLESTTFSDGVAWCYTDKGSCVINSKGEVVYWVDSEKYPYKDGLKLIMTPFRNGLSAVYYTDGKYSCPGILIINSKGETVYESNDKNLYLSVLASGEFSHSEPI